MCTVISADCVLANAFAHGKTSVSIRELKVIRTKVEGRLADVYVSLSIDSILGAVHERPDLFRWDDEKVECIESARMKLDTKYVDKYFNWRIPTDMRGAFLAVFQG